jgi:pimeloyl-ACP methyl ester carboxylesterase
MTSTRTLRIPLEDAILEADLSEPEGAAGVILFAHGSGSGRLSPRNRRVAARLAERFSTLLIDLLSAEEAALDELSGELRFDIDLLGHRILEVTRWIDRTPSLRGMPLGYFGSSTGAAAALVAAAALPTRVQAVVSRGGRPDLAIDVLAEVRAPTLFIVGG